MIDDSDGDQHDSQDQPASLLERVTTSRAFTMASAILPPTLKAVFGPIAEQYLGIDATDLFVAMMSATTNFHSPRSAERINHALKQMASDMKAGPTAGPIDPELVDEWLDVLTRGMHSIGRKSAQRSRDRIRKVLVSGLTRYEPPDRAAIFVEIAGRLNDADVDVLSAIASCYDEIRSLDEHSREDQVERDRLVAFVARLSAERPLSRDVLGREGLVPPESEKALIVSSGSMPFEVTPLGRAFLEWSRSENVIDVHAEHDASSEG